MTTAEILRYAAIVAGYALALARLTDTARPLWQFLPAKLQPLMPALLVVLPDLAIGLQKGASVEDILNTLVTGAGALMISLRGAVPAKHFEQLSPEAKSEIAAVRGKAPKDDDGPPTPRTGAGAAPIVALLLAGSLALSGAVTACASSPPPKGCTEQDAAKVAAICAARVQTECVDKGIVEADCKVIAECDAQADAYQKDCSQ
jgi:hypothetical protein